MSDNLIKALDIIRSIIMYLFPILTAFIGMKVQSSLDMKKEYQNYFRKRREDEIGELKEYHKIFSNYLTTLIEQANEYDRVLDNEIPHVKYLEQTKIIFETDFTYITLMQNLYFNQEELKPFQTYAWEVVQVWMKNKKVDRYKYREAIMDMMKIGSAHQKTIIDTIKKKQGELLDKSVYFNNKTGK